MLEPSARARTLTGMNTVLELLVAAAIELSVTVVLCDAKPTRGLSSSVMSKTATTSEHKQSISAYATNVKPGKRTLQEGITDDGKFVAPCIVSLRKIRLASKPSLCGVIKNSPTSDPMRLRTQFSLSLSA